MAEHAQKQSNYLILMDLADKVDFINEAKRFKRRQACQSLCHV